MPDGKTSLGLPENIEALLAYPLGFISGGILFALEKESKYVKFHAMQSILISVLLTVINMGIGVIPLFNLSLLLIGPCELLFLIFLMFKAFTGEKFKIPVIGDQAEKYSLGQ